MGWCVRYRGQIGENVIAVSIGEYPRRMWDTSGREILLFRGGYADDWYVVPVNTVISITWRDK